MQRQKMEIEKCEFNPRLYRRAKVLSDIRPQEAMALLNMMEDQECTLMEKMNCLLILHQWKAVLEVSRQLDKASMFDFDKAKIHYQKSKALRELHLIEFSQQGQEHYTKARHFLRAAISNAEKASKLHGAVRDEYKHLYEALKMDYRFLYGHAEDADIGQKKCASEI